MFFPKKPEVLVVGAGPVGLFTALALTERNLRVQIVDKEWRPGTRSYALGLHAETLRILEQFGLLQPVLERARRIRTVGVFDGKERRTQARIAELPEDYSFLAILRQEDLEKLLADELVRRGVRVTWNHQVGRLVPLADRVAVDVDKLSKDSMGYAVQHTEWVVAKTKRLDVPFVVGADGHRSNVRQGLEIEFDEIGPPSEFAVFEFRTDADLGDEMRLTMTDDATDVCWPLPDGYVRFSFQEPITTAVEGSRDKDREMFQVGTALYPALDEEHLRMRLAERAPWFQGNIDGIRWRMLVRFEQRLARSFGAGRAWILGDAAHLTGPVGLHSMNVGFREALDLANLLADGAEPGAMHAFEEARRGEWRALLGLDSTLRPRSMTDPWLAARAKRLVPCLPASGEDYVRLADQLGFDCRMPAHSDVAHR